MLVGSSDSVRWGIMKKRGLMMLDMRFDGGASGEL